MKKIQKWESYDLIEVGKGEIIPFPEGTRFPYFIAEPVLKGENRFIFNRPALFLGKKRKGQEGYNVFYVREYQDMKICKRIINDRRLVAAIIHWNKSVDNSREKIQRIRLKDGMNVNSLFCYSNEAIVRESDNSVFIIQLGDIDAIKAALPPK